MLVDCVLFSLGQSTGVDGWDRPHPDAPPTVKNKVTSMLVEIKGHGEEKLALHFQEVDFCDSSFRPFVRSSPFDAK